MTIKWNEYTWYSKLLAVILFIGVLPAWTFYLGIRYNEAMSVSGNPIVVQNNTQSPTVVASASDELTQTKFKLFILDLYGVRDVFVNPLNKNQFYYIVNTNGGGGDIFVYDMGKDTTFAKTGRFDFPNAITNLFSRPPTVNEELRGVGIVDNKFVFFQTSIDSSPGPCYSDWLRGQLEYIDLNAVYPNIVAKPYTISDAMKQSETQKMDDCQASL